MPWLWRTIPVLVALAGAASLGLWLSCDPGRSVRERAERPAPGGGPLFEVKFPGQFAAGDGKPAEDLYGAWPCFRGEKYDAVAPDEATLARSWPPKGPRVLWSVPMGLGYAGPAVLGGRVYVLDYDEARQADALRCLSLADGKEIWRRWYEIPIESDHGMSRTVPAVTDKYAVTFGPKCHVMCVDAQTGDFRWAIDLVREYRAVCPKWYASQNPLLDRDRAILAPAGKEVLMLGVDCETGKVLWKTPNRRGWRMTHSSVIPMEFKSKRMYIYCASGGVAAVAAEDGEGVKAGDLLWERTDWQVPFANVPSPVVIGNGHLLLSGGYGGGAMLIRLREDGGKLVSETVWRLTKSKQFGSEQQTPVFYKGRIFAVLPKEAGGLGGQLVCMDLEGKHAWTSGAAARFGLGPYIIADGMILAMDDDGLLVMADANADAYRPLAKAKVLRGHETWAPMALAGGRLLVRDLKQMICLDVQKP
jgi:outer membrane protein assembly factor BamB